MLEVHTTGAEDYGQYTKALICGAPGAGKTLISSTWPNPIYASAEGGLMSIARRRIKFVKITAPADLKELKNALVQTPDVREQMFGQPIETLVVDTIDEIQKLYIRERLDSTRKESLDMQGWGWLGEQMRVVLRALRNLDMNVVFTCHLKETKDESTGQVFFKPALQGGVGDEIAQYMDLALLLRTETKTRNVGGEIERYEQRFLQTYKDSQHDWIKDRSGQLPPDLEVNFKDDAERIHKAIFGFMTEDWEKSAVRTVEALQEIADDTKSVTETPVLDVKDDGQTLIGSPTPASVVDESPEPDPVAELAEAAKGRETPAEVVQPEPEPEPNPEPEEATEAPTVSPEPKPQDEEGPWTCTTPDCGAVIDSIDQKELSEIMIRRIACTPCYRAEVDAGKTKKG